MTQSMTLLGATGSIGKSTLDIIGRHPDLFTVFALSAKSNVDELCQQCVRFQPQYAVIEQSIHFNELREKLKNLGIKTQALSGADALEYIASAPNVDLVLSAIVGAAGLMPSLAAAKAGKTILLANKETLVMAGELFISTAHACGAKILPIDSEHNAIFQVLPPQFSENPDKHGVSSIILTASGGPFLHRPTDTFQDITLEMALKHPNWSMGRKISIDSATMMNKGLELIEAKWLFNLPPEKIEIIVHPQSVIHSMVRFLDGSVLAQLGLPDMRTPIAYCLGLPNRIESGVAALDFTQLSALTFEPIDLLRFPCLKLAHEAILHQEDAPCVLNAANEIAVAAFLAQKIKFTEIPKIIEYCLEHIDLTSENEFDSLIQKDKTTRILAEKLISRYAS